MLFNSLEFVIFFAAFMLLWPLVRTRNNPRWIYITAASLFFYGWWNWRYLFVMCGTGLVDYFAGLAMERYSRWKKPIIMVSLLSNLGALVTFKYLAFFTNNFNIALNLFGSEYQIPVVHLVLPVGISFYTFQSMSYAIDVYKDQLKPTRNIFHFFAFLSMFPQLVAGPIIRAADLLPQLMSFNKTTERLRWDGLCLVMGGYFKKVVVADNLAPTIAAAFEQTVPLDSSVYWWLIMTMFAFQIYCDFSGYSDIARGLAKWMGYEFMVNFDHPYTAASIREFWSRWHISLSTWFKDYIYIPLGGSRDGGFASHKNMWITMLISGFWHGASWNFVIWGALHSAYLSVERITKWPERLSKLPFGKHLGVYIVFNLVLVSWVFFRAQSFGQAIAILSRMFSVSHFNLAAVQSLIAATVLAVLALIMLRQVYYLFGIGRYAKTTLGPRMDFVLKPVLVGLLIPVCIFFKGPGSAFIYFQF